MKRGGALLVTAALTCGLAVTSASAAGGACPSLDDGVTVVVDFQSLGGGTVVRCAPGDPDSGLAALAAAGFRVDQVANQPGFVCRIDGLPGPEAEDCADTPPARAYWGYSHAERGGSWSYRSSGAHVSDPPVGTVEGWAFNGNGGATQPTIPPPPPPEPEPEPDQQPEPEPSPPPQPRPSASPAAAQQPGQATPTASASPSEEAPAAETASPDARREVTPTPPADETTDPGTEVEAAAPDGTAGSPSGGPRGLVIGGLLVGALVLAGFVLRARGRRVR